MLGFSFLKVCYCFFRSISFLEENVAYPVGHKTKYRMGSNLYFKGFFLKILKPGGLVLGKLKNLWGQIGESKEDS